MSEKKDKMPQKMHEKFAKIDGGIIFASETIQQRK